ncbi:hypothetical protein EDB92DRAFT_1820199 [Lactarius akahatsu]|uniref:Uncharacterized protein n=1 Tax=Lactarius akahatsu TaxID=416441 RepID=A0AAD4Q3N0_9AGAM|nr:hypothetical protein EDB92DRAFT_1820199 [Lactarius akahatsu]
MFRSEELGCTWRCQHLTRLLVAHRLGHETRYRSYGTRPSLEILGSTPHNGNEAIREQGSWLFVNEMCIVIDGRLHRHPETQIRRGHGSPGDIFRFSFLSCHTTRVERATAFALQKRKMSEGKSVVERESKLLFTSREGDTGAGLFAMTTVAYFRYSLLFFTWAVNEEMTSPLGTNDSPRGSTARTISRMRVKGLPHCHFEAQSGIQTRTRSLTGLGMARAKKTTARPASSSTHPLPRGVIRIRHAPVFGLYSSERGGANDQSNGPARMEKVWLIGKEKRGGAEAKDRTVDALRVFSDPQNVRGSGLPRERWTEKANVRHFGVRSEE